MKMMNRKLMINYATCVLAAAVFVVFGTKALAADKDELKRRWYETNDYPIAVGDEGWYDYGMMDMFDILNPPHIGVSSMFMPSIVSADEKCDVGTIDGTNFEENEPFYSKDEAAAIALCFVQKRINENEDCTWKENTAIISSYTVFDIEDNVDGYVFCLETDGKSSGYISIAAGVGSLPIREYSFEGYPVFKEKLPESTMNEVLRSENNTAETITKIIYVGGFDYFVRNENGYYDLDGKTVMAIPPSKANQERNIRAIIENKKMKSYINEWRESRNNYAGQLSGYAISDLGAYLVDRYGSYSLQDGNILGSFVGLDMSIYGNLGDWDCILVTITAIANWYRSSYPNIPSSISDIYSDVRIRAIAHGYTDTAGVSHTYADNIVEEVFSDWGYTVSAYNSYVLTFSTVKSQIDSPNSNPVMFNIATGYYSNHTVAIIGYFDYDVANFLCVKDNWSTSTRYIHWEAMSLDWGCFTIINA